MDPKYVPFLSESQIAGMHDLINRGLSTAQELNRENVTVTVQRYDKAAGMFTPRGEIRFVTITFGLREGKEYLNRPIKEVYADGDCNFWADEPVQLETGDRFIWQGSAIEVIKVFPPKNGVRNAEIRMRT